MRNSCSAPARASKHTQRRNKVRSGRGSMGCFCERVFSYVYGISWQEPTPPLINMPVDVVTSRTANNTRPNQYQQQPALRDYTTTKLGIPLPYLAILPFKICMTAISTLLALLSFSLSSTRRLPVKDVTILLDNRLKTCALFVRILKHFYQFTLECFHAF